jgi:hypothetical protein
VPPCRRLGLLFAAITTACQTLPTSAGEPIVTTSSGRTVAALQTLAYDDARHDATCKVFHHVHAPDGRLLTKGLGGEFPHHRGLFLGWNQVRCGTATFDFWHCRRGESQRFAGWDDGAGLELGSGGWQVARIAWCRADGTPVLHERRALRAVDIAGDAAALDVVVELRAADLPVSLRGDAQHAGQQFRALAEFATEGAPEVTYVRPPGAVAGKDDLWTGCTWTAAVLPLAGGPVTVLRIEGADNPQPVTWSTRAYGRFGAMVHADVTAEQPLALRWRYVIADGSRDVAWCAAQAAGH